MSKDTLVSVDGVSKKFCRSLKRSLWYGVQDVTSELLGREGGHGKLRQGEFWAVDNVSFKLRSGECLGLIGPNGAGKSTLLKVLNGLIKPDKGHITMRGRVGALIELGAGFNPILTARENIFVNGSVLGFTKNDMDRKLDSIIAFAEIDQFVDAPVQSFSSGMRVRLGFSIASQLEPNVLIIDEVLAVGDLGFRQKCFQVLSEKKQDGTSIILVSHNMTDILRLADLGLLIDTGKSRFLGSASEACANYDILLSSGNRTKSESGSSPYQIRSIRLFRMGVETKRFQTGDDIEALVEVECQEDFNGARMNFHLDSASFRLNSTSTLVNGTDLKFSKGTNQVKLIIKNNDLLQGGYLLQFDLYGMRRNEFYDHSEPIEFLIEGPPIDMYGFGVAHVVRVDHQWITN